MKQKTLLLINPVIQTTRDCPMMDSDALMQAIVRSKRKIFSRPVIWRKAILTLFHTQKLIISMMLTLNYGSCRNIFLKGSEKLGPPKRNS